MGKANEKRKAILAVLISFILTILVVEPVWATTISDLEDQKRQLEEEKRRAAELKTAGAGEVRECL